MSPEFYFHDSFIPCSKWNNVLPYRMHNELGSDFICLSNSNSIEIYRVTTNTVVFHSRSNLMCNIAKMEVLPSKHQSSDYIFVIDEVGRWAIWRSTEGQVQVSNKIIKESSKSRMYRETAAAQQQPQFIGKILHFKVNDTVGTVFYTVGCWLILLEVAITRSGCTVNQQTIRQLRIPYLHFRHVGAINNGKQTRLIGIIEEVEERTILKVHDLEGNNIIDNHSLLESRLEKINLQHFSCDVPMELIVVTYNQVSIYGTNLAQPICNYCLRGNYGRCCALGNGFYVHFGEDITVFSKSIVKNYGPLRFKSENVLEDNGVLECRQVGKFANGQLLLSLLTFTNQLYLLVLYEEKWRLVRKMCPISSVFSLLSVPDLSHTLVAVCSNGNRNKINVIERLSETIRVKQQSYPFVVDSLWSINNGRVVVVSSRQDNSAMKYDDKSHAYMGGFNLPSQLLLAVGKDYFVNQNGIYSINYIKQTYVQIVHEHILSAVTNDLCICYETASGFIKWFNCLTATSSPHARKTLFQYGWHLLSENCIVLAVDQQSAKLRILSMEQEKEDDFIQIDPFIVSGIAHRQLSSSQGSRIIDESADLPHLYHIIVGFVNGKITIYDFASKQLLEVFQQQTCSPISFASCFRDNIVVLGGCQQYLLMCQQGRYRLHQLQFSCSQNYISALVYLQVQDCFLFVENNQESTSRKILYMNKLRSSEYAKSSREMNLELQTGLTITTLFETKQDIVPLAFVKSGNIYIASKEEVSMHSIKDKRLIKKQSHILTEVVAIGSINFGLLLLGIDLIDRCTVLIVSSDDLEIKGSINLGSKKVPRSMKCLPGSNRFFLRYDTVLSLYQIVDTNHATELQAHNLGIRGYAIDIQSAAQKVVVSDPFKYVVTYDYKNTILPLCRNIGPYMVNDVVFLGNALITGDKGGLLRVLEFNMADPCDINKTMMTSVGSLYVSEQIFVLQRIEDKHGQVLYGGISGSIGRMQVISKQEFSMLKKVQLEAMKRIERNKRFSYGQWRRRNVENDKLIDEELIRSYLEEGAKKPKTVSEEFYYTVERLHRRLIS